MKSNLFLGATIVALIGAFVYFAESITDKESEGPVPPMQVTASLPDNNGVVCYSTVWYDRLGFACVKVK